MDQKIICISCKGSIPKDSKFCHKCGFDILNSPQSVDKELFVKCHKCFVNIPKNIKFCPRCGVKKKSEFTPAKGMGCLLALIIFNPFVWIFIIMNCQDYTGAWICW